MSKPATSLVEQIRSLEGPKLYGAEIVCRLGLALFVYYVLPGLFVADVQHYFRMASKVDLHHLPYRDVTWEFPPLTVFLAPLVKITGNDNATFHVLFVPLMVLCEWSSMHILRRLDHRRFWSITAFWSATVLPFGVLAWNRLDFVPVLFAALALRAMARNKSLVLWSLLGFLAKLWPVLFVVHLFVHRRGRELVVLTAAIGLSVLAWYSFSPQGFHVFLQWRRGIGFQVESLPGSVLHFLGRPYIFRYGTESVSDDGWAWLQPLLLIGTCAGVAAIALLARRRNHDDVMVVGACVAISLVCSRIISTQFLVWLAPFIALRLPGNALMVKLYAFNIWSSLLLLGFYDQFSQRTLSWEGGLMLVRNGALLALTIVMVRAAFSNRTRESIGADSFPRFCNKQTFEKMRE